MSVSFNTEDFNRYSYRERFSVILGGPVFGILYGVSLFIIFWGIQYLMMFALLIIFSEFINLIVGQDGRVLEELLKERKDRNENY
jgi:hypothetical protein